MSDKEMDSGTDRFAKGRVNNEELDLRLPLYIKTELLCNSQVNSRSSPNCRHLVGFAIVHSPVTPFCTHILILAPVRVKPLLQV